MAPTTQNRRMREPDQPQLINTIIGPIPTSVTYLLIGGAPISLETTMPSPHPGNKKIEHTLLIAPPNANDVRKQKNVSQASPGHKTPSMNQKHPHHCKTMPDK